jgi:hypothetical protein
MLQGIAGAANAGIQMGGQAYVQNQQRKANSANRRITKRDRQSQLESLSLAARETDRLSNKALFDVDQDRAGEGDTSANYYSTQRGVEHKDINDERKRRLDAISKEYSRLQSNWKDEDKAYRAQKKAARMNYYMGMVNSAISGLGGLAGGM